MSWFETLASRVPYEGPFVRVRVDTLRLPDGGSTEREVVEQDDAVAVVPLLSDRTVLLLRQYRHPLGRALLEIPAGKLDVPGEEVEDAAQRELIEEVAHRATTLRHLVTIHNSAGWTDERTHIYLATGLKPQDPPDGYTPSAEEADMEVARVPLTEAVALVERGDITDAKTALGLLLTERQAG